MTNEEVRELGALYALGALDEASSRDLESMLDRLPEDFRQEILGWRELVGLLPLSLEPAQIPPHLRQRLLADISSSGSQEIPQTPATIIPLERERAASAPVARYLLIAATVVLAIIAGLLYRSNRQLQSRVADLTRSLDASRARFLAEARDRDQIIASSTRMVSLSGGAVAPQASARLFWDTGRQEWVIYFFNLPAIPADREYQLWYITNDQRKVSARVFRDEADGRVELRVILPREIISNVAAAAVTLEPRGGSPQPTGQLVLNGAI